MAAGHAERQGDITHRAFTAMGRDEAIRFLNSEHDALGGRPLALATKSDAGKAAVMAELERLKRLCGA